MKLTKMKKTKRRHVTLIEMMIVMFLIAMIIGVVAYNYQGSLDEGKAFKTKTGIEKVKTILMLKISDDPAALQNIGSEWETYIDQSPLVQNKDALKKDGWGQKYQVNAVEVNGNQEIEVTSQKYEGYKAKTSSSMFK